jgi:catechol 2,3-dioxygenase-like lactoylglutathione lyase family enzyme
MRIIGVDHVQIAFPPELESKVVAFYEKTLGLARLQKPPGAGKAGAWFDAGNTQVHVGLQAQRFVPARKAHVGFIVQDLAAIARLLEAEDLPLKQGRDIPGFTRLFSEDPAGNRLEFLQRL